MGTDDEKAIRKLVATNEAGWNSHDMKMLGFVFRDDAEFINVVGMHWRGKDAIVKAHAAFHETSFKECKIKPTRDRFGRLAKTMLSPSGYARRMRLPRRRGAIIPKHQNIFTLVCAKDANSGG